MQSSCAHHVPHYTVQAFRARGKRAVILPHAFGLPAIVAGWTWCATNTASAAAASTATITTASTPRATRRRGVRYARGPRRTLCSHDRQRAPRNLSVHAVVLCASCSPLYSPGASRKNFRVLKESSYLTLSGCQLLLQGGPGVRQARKHGIGSGSKYCDDNDTQPDA